MSTPQPDPSVVGVYLRDVQATTIHISGVTVQNITQLPKPPPLWVNVPRLPPRFVGRDTLVDDLVRLLQAGPGSAAGNAGGIAAVHGLPGAGKSALAVVLAHHPALRAHFSDGVLWAGLGPIPDVMSLLAAWGDALGVDVTDQPAPELRSQAVSNAIGQQKLLLVIDDAWQLEPSQHLRCGGPNCAHLLTSRDLGLAWEFAGEEERTLSVPALGDDAAFALLKKLAPKAWAADPETAQQLARSLGGLPLALELVGKFLAAPRRSLFAVLGSAALNEMADPARRLALVSVRLGSVDGRQVSLQETIALSLAYLPESAVAAFHALGAFAPKPASFDLAAAEAVSQADAEVLATLVERSLVEQAGPETLALHQVVADVARGALPPEAVGRHRAYYLGVVEEDPEDWQRIETIYPQIAHVWQQVVADNTEDRTLLEFVDTLRLYQQRRGLWQDMIAWVEKGLSYAQAHGLGRKAASMLVDLGYVYAALGDQPQALAYFEQALPLQRRIGDQAGEARTLNNMGRVYDALGDKPQALACYERALPLWRQAGDQAGEAATVNNMGLVYAALGDQPQALAYHEQALELMRQAGDRAGEATTLNNLGAVYAALGDQPQALACYEQALPLRQQVGDRAGEARTLNNMAIVSYQQGQVERGAELLAQAVDLFRAIGAAQEEAACLYNLAFVHKALGARGAAIQCLTRSIALLEQHRLDRDSGGDTLAEHRRLLAELAGKG